MAKKKSSWKVGWPEVALAGVAGFGLYKWLSSATPAAAAPSTATPGAPGAIPARGPGYQGWLNTLTSLNYQFISGAITLPALQQRLADAQSAINQDWVAGYLTTADVADLKRTIAAYGG